MKRFSLIFPFFLLSYASYADDYLVEVKDDDKIIHVDELHLPLSATVEDAIFILPELLCRPGYDVLNNYDIEVNGFSIGSSKDVVLSNIYAYKINKITISESPANSYNNNGQGGTIKIDLKDPSDGYSGSADISANSSWNVMPSVQLDYKNKKGDFLMHFFAMGELHRSSSDDIRYHLDPLSESRYNEYSDTTRKKYDSQLLRTYMKYAPDSRNKFEFVLSADRISDGSDNIVESSRPVSDKDVKYNADANLKYILSTDAKGSEFTFESKFGFHPVNEYQDIPDFRSRQTYGKNWSLVGSVEYKPVFTDMLTMFFGSDYNLSRGNSDFSESTHYVGPRGPAQYSTHTGTTYLSPYVKAHLNLGKWSFKASLEYQFYEFEVSSSNLSEPFSNVLHDVTGSVYANWQLASHHNLRFSFERKLKRPSVFQMTPDWSFDTSTYDYILGNENLIPMKVHDIGIDYITDTHTANGYFTLNAGLDYMYVNDIVKTTSVAASPSLMINEYLTFENSGHAGIVCGNLLLYYRTGILSVSVSGNIFYNNGIDEGIRTNHTYYNASLQSTLSLPSDWIVLARALWYGDVITQSSNTGGFSLASLNVAKTWGHVTVGLSGQLPFPRYALDSSINDSGLVSYLSYRPTYAYAELKFSYRF